MCVLPFSYVMYGSVPSSRAVKFMQADTSIVLSMHYTSMYVLCIVILLLLRASCYCMVHYMYHIYNIAGYTIEIRRNQTPSRWS